jgi:hypothetical protein
MSEVKSELEGEGGENFVLAAEEKSVIIDLRRD